MSRADDVAQKIREAANHPNVPLLFAIGAERPKPQSAASAAYVLGLTVQEEKFAKWVAVLKRDAEELFGKPFLEALRDILGEGESEMEVKRGRVFFHIKVRPLLRKLAKDLIKDGAQTSDYWLNSFFETDSNALDESLEVDIELSGMRLYHIGKHGHIGTVGFETHDHDITTDDGLNDLHIRVKDKRCMKTVRAFAFAWEAKSKQLRGSREAKVTIFQDYA